MEREYVGELVLEDTVEITDSCYEKGVWCQIITYCVPGLYKGYADIVDDEDWGIRVARLSIYKDDIQVDLKDMKLLDGEVGVDAGLAGFFRDKPDLDAEWSEFCDKLFAGGTRKMSWADSLRGDRDALWSESGCGDGGYSAYANDDHSAFTIVFM